MIPEIQDSAFYLFTNKPNNKPNDPTVVNISEIFDVEKGTKIYFMYQVKKESNHYISLFISPFQLIFNQ